MTIKQIEQRLIPPRGKPSTEPPRAHPFDVEHGTDTGGVIAASKLRSRSGDDIHNFGYVGSQPSIIRSALEKIPDLDGATFVDLGCGKARPVMVATEFPFSRVIGVELSGALCEVARANVAKIAAPMPVEIIEADAARYELPAGRLVVFLYNPFFSKLMRRVANRIAEHAGRPGNRVMVVYYNPVSAEIFDKHPAFSRFFAGRFLAQTKEVRASGWSGDGVVIWQAGEHPLDPHDWADAKVVKTAGGAGADVWGQHFGGGYSPG